MNATEFKHLDNGEAHLSLHDCTAEKVYIREGKLVFEFSDGFWIFPSHPENPLGNTVRSDFSKVEYILDRKSIEDVMVYVFEETLFKKTVRKEWTLDELIKNIYCGKCRLELLYQYTDESSRLIECMIWSDRRPYHREGIIKINGAQANYYWNNLCADRTW